MTIENKQQKKGRKFETVVQKSIGSGNLWFSPLDINCANFCIEAKYTDKKGFRISKELIDKIWNKALNMNKEPALIVGIKRNDEQIYVLHCRINIERKI